MLLPVLWLASGGAQAGAYFSELPTNEIATPEQIRKDFVNMQFEPLDDPQLAMSFLVGKDWQPQPLTVAPDRLEADHRSPVELVLVLSADKKARISVAYLRVDKDTDVQEWVRQYLRGNRLSPDLTQVGDFSGRNVVDTLISAPGKQKVRMTFSKHNDRIIILAGSCPEDAYSKYARHFGLAAVSLSLAH